MPNYIPRWSPRSLGELLGRVGLDGFMLALLSVIALAYLWPFPGSQQSPLPLAPIANVGVSFIFFFYGLKLSPAKLRKGLGNWRLPILIHGATFLLFPLVVWCIKPLFVSAEWQVLWLGVFFLAVLPSTVSSSVVMVSIAGGNIPAAIFNASISSLLGVFLTPLWMAPVLNSTTADFALGPVLMKLILQVIVPVLLGLLLHSRAGHWAERYKKTLRYFDQTTILLIVYTSFCDSFERQLFAGVAWSTLAMLALAMLALLAFMYTLLRILSRAWGFDAADEITAVFCGSKKSLVQGAVMSNVLFAGAGGAGLYLLPLMLYHSIQLVVVGMQAARLGRQPHT